MKKRDVRWEWTGAIGEKRNAVNEHAADEKRGCRRTLARGGPPAVRQAFKELPCRVSFMDAVSTFLRRDHDHHQSNLFHEATAGSDRTMMRPSTSQHLSARFNTVRPNSRNESNALPSCRASSNSRS